MRLLRQAGEPMAETTTVAVNRRESAEPAFNELVAQELAAAYRAATLILGDPGEAEDAVQEAFLRAWQRWDRLRDHHRAGAWFGRILMNVCRDRLRARKSARIRWLFNESVEAPSDPSEREALREALGDLSPDHKIVVVLRYYVDLSLEAIAERTGAPVGTVKSRLHHGLEAMRAAYAARDRTAEPKS